MVARPAARANPGRSRSPTELPPLQEALKRRALRRFLEAACVFRVVGTGLVAGGTVPFGAGSGRWILYIALVLIPIYNGVLLLAARRRPQVLAGRALFVLDVMATVFLNLGASWFANEGTFDRLLGPADLFWPYAVGTAALWTVQRSSAVGVTLLMGSIPLHLGMGYLNGLSLTTIEWPVLAVRVVFLLIAFGFSVFVLRFADGAVELATRESERAGRATQRAEDSRKVHDVAIRTLGHIAETAAAERLSEEDRLRSIGGAAREQRRRLQTWLEGSGEEVGDLYEALGERAATFEGETDIRVELPLPLGRPVSIEPQSKDRLLEAVDEALENVWRHAAAHRVTILLRFDREGVGVSIQDDGRGFDPSSVRERPLGGLANSIRKTVEEVGGWAHIESSSGQGTVVDLWVPALEGGRGV